MMTARCESRPGASADSGTHRARFEARPEQWVGPSGIRAIVSQAMLLVLRVRRDVDLLDGVDAQRSVAEANPAHSPVDLMEVLQADLGRGVRLRKVEPNVRPAPTWRGLRGARDGERSSPTTGGTSCARPARPESAQPNPRRIRPAPMSGSSEDTPPFLADLVRTVPSGVARPCAMGAERASGGRSGRNLERCRCWSPKRAGVLRRGGAGWRSPVPAPPPPARTR
jgi:hypothetical protein